MVLYTREHVASLGPKYIWSFHTNEHVASLGPTYGPLC